MISPKIAISGFLIKWMCCSIILLEHNPTMSSLRHNSLESHSKNHQCKHVWSTNMICPEITMADRTYQVCALTMFAQSQNFLNSIKLFSFISIHRNLLHPSVGHTHCSLLSVYYIRQYPALQTQHSTLPVAMTIAVPRRPHYQ